MFVRNLRTMRVAYWVNVSESSGAGLPIVYGIVPYKRL